MSLKLSELTIGHTYNLDHCRFGTAKVKVLKKSDDESDAFMTVEVVEGTLRGINDSWGPGDEKTVRVSHCTFTPIPA